MIKRSAKANLRSQHRGATLVEAVTAIVVVGVMLVATLNTLAASQVGQRQASQRKVANLLAEQLMDEVLRQEYQDPGKTPIFGPEAGESTVSRAAFDDVDDYATWNESPPQEKDGTAIPDRTAWRRRVQVRWAAPGDVRQLGVTESGIKHVTVTVLYNNQELAKLLCMRTGKASTAPLPDIQ